MREITSSSIRLTHDTMGVLVKVSQVNWAPLFPRGYQNICNGKKVIFHR